MTRTVRKKDHVKAIAAAVAAALTVSAAAACAAACGSGELGSKDTNTQTVTVLPGSRPDAVTVDPVAAAEAGGKGSDACCRV